MGNERRENAGITFAWQLKDRPQQPAKASPGGGNRTRTTFRSTDFKSSPEVVFVAGKREKRKALGRKLGRE